MTQVDMLPYEKAYAEKHGLKISTEGDRYVVIDPEVPRKKGRFVGGNLYSLMLQAVGERPKIEPKTLTNVIEFETSKIEKDIPAPKAPKVKKELKHGKVYMMKMMILDNPKISNTEIDNQLKAAGMTASLSTIITVRNDFFNSISVLKKAGRYIEKEC